MSESHIHLYPMLKLPTLGLEDPIQMPRDAGTDKAWNYFGYNVAGRLTVQDETILQSMYIWVQTYHEMISQMSRTTVNGDITPQTSNPSYSELWWLTHYFSELCLVIPALRRCELLENIEMHKRCYENAIITLGVVYPTEQDSEPSYLIDYDSLTGSVKFHTRVQKISNVLKLNAVRNHGNVNNNMIRFYPIDDIPELCLITSPIITPFADKTEEESHYSRYGDAGLLITQDKYFLQSVYIWIQTYFTSLPRNEIIVPPITQPSYSELWWLTNYFLQLRVPTTRPPDAEQLERHRHSYDSAITSMGLTGWLNYELLNGPMGEPHGLIHHDTMTHAPRVYDLIRKIDNVLKLNAGVAQDLANGNRWGMR
jgi:hypothetical protein